MITASELIAILQALPPDTPVVRADSEYGPQDIRTPKMVQFVVTDEWTVEAQPGRPAHTQRELEMHYSNAEYQNGLPVLDALYIA
ncbi:MAG: hypothetical protein U0X20_16925 [Caldilineaceae bacterium]